jgi:hypothetical protein
MPTTDGEVTVYNPTEWAAHLAYLAQHRTNHTASDEDYIFCGRPIPSARNGADAFPAAFYALKEAALRGDLGLVMRVYEEDWLPLTMTTASTTADDTADNTATATAGRFSNKDLFNVFLKAFDAGHTPVVAFLLARDVPFRDHHPEQAVAKGMESLLCVRFPYLLGGVSLSRFLCW